MNSALDTKFVAGKKILLAKTGVRAYDVPFYTDFNRDFSLQLGLMRGIF